MQWSVVVELAVFLFHMIGRNRRYLCDLLAEENHRVCGMS